MTMLDFAHARQRMLARVEPVEDTETVALADALHRIVAEPVSTAMNLPPFASSAMDGYAFIHPAPISEPLQVVGTSRAGHPYEGHLQRGQAIRIFTGAMLPAAADAVAPQEIVDVADDRIHLRTPVDAGSHIRKPGLDLPAGANLVTARERLQAVHLALLASAGIRAVTCYRKIRLSIFTTGDELRDASQPLSPGTIYESNLILMQALSASPEIRIVHTRCLPDHTPTIRKHLLEAAEQADVMVVSGGMSVGDTDLVIQLLRGEGHLEFWKIAMKPGKPFAFGTLRKSWFFGLPGNPVSTAVSYMMLVKPCMERIAGARATQPVQIHAKLAEPLFKDPGRLDFQRGELYYDADRTLLVRATGRQDSNRISSLTQANCFIVVPADEGNLDAGTRVLVQPFAMGA